MRCDDDKNGALQGEGTPVGNSTVHQSVRPTWTPRMSWGEGGRGSRIGVSIYELTNFKLRIMHTCVASDFRMGVGDEAKDETQQYRVEKTSKIVPTDFTRAVLFWQWFYHGQTLSCRSLSWLRPSSWYCPKLALVLS